MSKLFLSILFLSYILSFHPAFSQFSTKNKSTGFYNITELGYGHGIGKIDFKKSGFEIANESKYFRLRAEFGYFVSNKISIGLGIGLDGYHDYTLNTAPMFIDVRYYLKDKPQAFFLSGNLGYALPLSSNFEQGILAGFTIGKKMSGRRIILLPSTGLNFQQIQNFSSYSFGSNQGGNKEENIWLTSLQFNLGFLF